MNFLKIINNIFGLLLFVSFFGVFISSIFFPHIKIGPHNFNTPAVLITLFFCCIFVAFTLKPFLKEKSGMRNKYSSGFGYFIVIFILASSTVGFGYFYLYLPLKSVYLTEFNFQNTNSVKISAKKGMTIFFEIDYYGANTKNGDQLEISLTGNSFNASSSIVIGKESRSDKMNKEKKMNKYYLKTTQIVFIKETIPFDGDYTITVQKISGNLLISNIRVYSYITN